MPSASESEESGAIYLQVFTDLGARSVEIIPLFKPDDADLSDVTKELVKATGIFMTGGDQSKIARILHGTASLRAIKGACARGATIGGNDVTGVML